MKHGTRNGWVKHGCRCDLCWDARLEGDRRRRQSRKERFAGGLIDAPHGRSWTAREYGCKCDPCRLAQNDAAAERRRKNGIAPARRFTEAEKSQTVAEAHESGAKVAAARRCVSVQTVYTWAREAGRPLRRQPPTDWPHGTYQRYRKGCKCEPCKAANTERTYAVVANRRAKAAAGEITVPHGTRNGYSNYGCRCEQCTAVNSWASAIGWKRWAERRQQEAS